MPPRLIRFADVARLLAAFVVASMLVGVFAAGLALPAVGATGAAARTGVHFFDSLPGAFTQTPLSQQSRILAADGSLIATPSIENRRIIPLSQVSKVMRQAQVDIEDNRFYQHGGVDLHGIARAVVANSQGTSVQGASTLTQQYVKITLQENAIRNGDQVAAAQAVAPSYTRKLQQLKYAVVLEQRQSKDQILQGYFNLVYYGGQAYGIEAAAEHYFGVHASQLDLHEAALLAGLVQAPTALDPAVHPTAARARRNVVLDTMHHLRHISTAQWRAAKRTQLDLHVTPSRSSCAASKYHYFCDYILRWLRDQPALGRTVVQREDAIDRQGLTIRTTFDPKIQQIAQDAIEKRVPTDNSAGIASAATVIQPGTGKVLAMAQDTRYLGKHSVQQNYNVDYKYGSSGGFQYGSTAKLYAVVAALESGMTGDSSVFVRGATAGNGKTIFYPHDYRRDGCRQYTPYRVGNDEGSTTAHTITLTHALASSINIAFAGLIAKLGLCTVHRVMEKMGLHTSAGTPTQTFAPSITLGADSVSPMTMAASYATVAAHGLYCTPQPVSAITTSDNRALPVPTKMCKQVVDPGIAAQAAQILSHVLTDGTAKGVGPVPGRPSAGKTGTTDNNKQVWFVGFTAQLATAVWVGTPKTPKPMNHVSLAGKYIGKVYGASVPCPIWKDITTQASKGMPVLSFGTASDTVAGGPGSTSSASPSSGSPTSGTSAVPDVSGTNVATAVAALSAAGYSTAVGGTVRSSYPAGFVVSTTPGPGSHPGPGTTITLRVSGP